MGAARVGPRRLVLFARRRWTAARTVEGALLGLAAALGTSAAAALSGAAVAAPSALIAAALAGGFASATWVAEGRRDGRDIARRIDVRLERGGEFATACEVEDGAAGSLAGALVARVTAEVGPREVRRAISPPSVAFGAAPLLAAAVLVVSLEHGPGERAAPTVRALAAALASAAGSGAEADPPEGGAPLLELASEAARLAAPESGRAAAELRHGLEAIRAELERRLEVGVEPTRPELERARELAERALAELGAPVRPARPDGLGGDPNARDAGGAGAGELAAGGGDDTMGGSPARGGSDGPEDEAPALADASADGGDAPPEAGVAVGRWWDERYDAIVAPWVELEDARRRN
jgi:MFS family permease